MARRDAGARDGEGRIAIRERQGAQQRALTGFFACRSRRDALEAALAALAAEE